MTAKACPKCGSHNTYSVVTLTGGLAMCLSCSWRGREYELVKIQEIEIPQYGIRPPNGSLTAVDYFDSVGGRVRYVSSPAPIQSWNKTPKEEIE